MKLHPREKIVNEAKLRLARAITDISEGLTEHELMRVVASECLSIVQNHAKYGIRFERHGNYEDEGGLA